MSYALEIPKELVKEMYFIRENTGISIRKQIIQAIKDYLDDKEKQEIDSGKNSLVFKQINENTSGVYNLKTGRFHDSVLGIDVVY